eukprot:68945-Alexandrium_andersonii.AAC.1
MQLGCVPCSGLCAWWECVLECVLERVNAAYVHVQGAKHWLACCGFNPEGNMTQSESGGSLEAAFALTAPPELPWLSKSAVRAAVRNRQGAEELAATARAVRRSSQAASVFSVASAHSVGQSYGVEAEL